MGDDLTRALETWLASGAAAGRSAATVQRETLWELDRLLGSGLATAAQNLPGLELEPELELASFVEVVGRRLEEGDADAALVDLLAPDRARAGASLVAALAEILFVPRLQRTEYLANTLPSPPWRIGLLLLEYAVWSVRIDEELGALTKGFCARSCTRLPVGCCSVLGYDMGVVPEAMLSAQELEARAQGWTPPEREDTCRYHGPRGCHLRLFKSPACAGMLCDALIDDLRDRFEEPAPAAFLEALARFRNHTLDRAAVFEHMAAVAAAGGELTRSCRRPRSHAARLLRPGLAVQR